MNPESALIDFLQKIGLVAVGGSSPVLTYFGAKYIIEKFTGKNGNTPAGNNGGAVKPEDCRKRHEAIQGEMQSGALQFKELKLMLNNMSEKFTDFYDRNDKSYLRILDELGGKDGLKDRILTLEIKFDDYVEANSK